MLMEAEVEAKIAAAVRAAAPRGVSVTAAREASAAVKSDALSGHSAQIVVATGLRAYDAFGITTANIGCSVSVFSRADCSPTSSLHDAAVEAVVNLLCGWHADGGRFSAEVSTDHFFAGEIRLDGGDGKSFDDESGCWTESVAFTIRGATRTTPPNTNGEEL